MCTLALFFRVNPQRPLVVAANRDEYLARPAADPQLLLDSPWVVGGRDLVAGGTWLGLNAHGLVAGLLNRRTATPPDPARRSRGHLCLDALRHPSVEAALRWVAAEPPDRYNPFNLLLASPEVASVVSNLRGTMDCRALDPGLHLLTNLDVNDFECPRIARSYGRFAALSAAVHGSDAAALCEALREVLADHSTPLDPRGPAALNTLCIHTPAYGTRSWTVIVAETGGETDGAPHWRMWHGAGPPCTAPAWPVGLPGGGAPRQVAVDRSRLPG